MLYPASHPAIQASLARVTESATRLRAGRRTTLTVLPDRVLLENRALPKPDPALTELAALLHAHLVGHVALLDDPTPAGWHAFLRLIGRNAEDVRMDGGIVRVWTAANAAPIELQQIDYREVLRERRGLHESDWDRIIASCLEGDRSALDEQTLTALVELLADPERFLAFTERFVSRTLESAGGQRDAILVLLQALADFVAERHPETIARTLADLARVLPRLTPELLLLLLTGGERSGLRDGNRHVDLAREMHARLTDQAVAEFVARSVARTRGATERLAEAFQVLAPAPDARTALLERARHDAEGLAIGQEAGFAELWQHAADLLSSYSDSRFVSEDYERELAAARTQAVDVERVSDDPPERIQSWLSTVSASEVRRLDRQVLLDLLVVETRTDIWPFVLESALRVVEELVLSGHPAAARPLLDAVAARAQPHQPFAAAARAGLDRLRAGPLLHHVVLLARHASDDDVKDLAACARALGTDAIRPLAEALAIEEGGAARRLGEIVLSFGAAGRVHAAELRRSTNPAVRRVAVELLRAFGGPEDVAQLAEMLGDEEPGVQRDVVRALIQIGSDEAHETLQQALDSGPASTREAIQAVLRTSSDPRAVPIFVRVLDRPRRGPRVEELTTLAIEGLGRLGGDGPSLAALQRALERGHWWAPLRTQRLRAAAAGALARSGSPTARRILEHAATHGTRGVRREASRAIATTARSVRKAH
jgi:hypothetical protein